MVECFRLETDLRVSLRKYLFHIDNFYSVNFDFPAIYCFFKDFF